MSPIIVHWVLRQGFYILWKRSLPMSWPLALAALCNLNRKYSIGVIFSARSGPLFFAPWPCNTRKFKEWNPGKMINSIVVSDRRHPCKLRTNTTQPRGRGRRQGVQNQESRNKMRERDIQRKQNTILLVTLVHWIFHKIHETTSHHHISLAKLIKGLAFVKDILFPKRNLDLSSEAFVNIFFKTLQDTTKMVEVSDDAFSRSNATIKFTNSYNNFWHF